MEKKNQSLCFSTKLDDIVENVLSQQLFKSSVGRLYCKDSESEDVYHPVSDNEARIEVYNLLAPKNRGKIPSSTISEVLKRVAMMPEVQFDFTVNREKGFIRVRNGIYSVEDQKLIEVSALDDGEKILFPYKYDFDYIEKCVIEDATVFHKFLDSAFEGTDKEQKTKLLLQMFGYCLSEYTRGKCAMFFLGPSNSGKSVLLGVLRSGIDERSYTTLELTKLGKRFNRILLADSRVNICDEISGDVFDDIETFKCIVSGEMLTGEFKGKDPIQFRPQVKLISAGNVLPRLKDSRGIDAVINRMVVLKFPRSIPKQEQDLELREKLVKEKNVIFSLALDSLKTLKANNFIFEEDKDSQMLVETFYQTNNVADRFLGDMAEINLDVSDDDLSWKLHTSEIWERFCKYCEDNCIDRRISKNELNHILQEKGLRKLRFRKDGKNAWGYCGIRIKN